MTMLGIGTYDATVKNCGYQPIKDGRPPQLSIYFEDDAGAGAISWFTTLGYIKDGTFSMKAYEFAADQLRGLGWDDAKQNFRFEELADPATSPIFGVHAQIVVANDPFNGVDKIKVKYINAAGYVPGGGERMDAQTTHQWADLLRTKLRDGGKPVGPAAATRGGYAPMSGPPAATAAPAVNTRLRLPPDPTFDDIPF